MESAVVTLKPYVEAMVVGWWIHQSSIDVEIDSIGSGAFAA
jgi:hypothetical protein